MLKKKSNDRDVNRQLKEEVEEMHGLGPEGCGYSSCCVLMCEALVFSIMLISLCFFVVLAGVC